jgi:hypothetical protein
MKAIASLLLLSLAATAATSSPAQTLFSDSLASDTSAWIVNPANQGDGALSFSSSRLNFLVASPGATDTGYRQLGTYAAPSTSSWSAQVDVHLGGLAGLVADQFANLNLVVVKEAAPSSYNASFALDTYNAGSGVVRDFDTHVTTGGTQIQLTEVTTSTLDASLQIGFNPVTNLLTFSADSDGAGVGATFLAVHTADISGWSMSGGNFAFLLTGSSGNESGAGPVISPGVAYFQNFSVTAVPEPSTFAMLAGALALAVAGLFARNSARR